jgi:type II secretory pathway component PulK
MIVAALVCLLIVTSIVASMLQSALRSRRQLHVERNRRQTEFLLEAGANRASERMAADPDYRGDTWELPADAIVGRGAGRVTTNVSHSEDNNSLQLHIVAEYPLDRDFPIRRSQTFQITSAPTQTQE